MVATNSSSISITRLAASTDRPERFIGIHFMNPVPVMQLVELIRGLATDDDTFNAAKALAEKLGKTTATAEDFPAFIVNRDRKSTRLNSSHANISYAVFCLKKKKHEID